VFGADSRYTTIGENSLKDNSPIGSIQGVGGLSTNTIPPQIVHSWIPSGGPNYQLTEALYTSTNITNSFPTSSGTKYYQ
jgi:uncharacterized protein (DUF2235 family)